MIVEMVTAEAVQAGDLIDFNGRFALIYMSEPAEVLGAPCRRVAWLSAATGMGSITVMSVLISDGGPLFQRVVQ